MSLYYSIVNKYLKILLAPCSGIAPRMVGSMKIPLTHWHISRGESCRHVSAKPQNDRAELRRDLATTRIVVIFGFVGGLIAIGYWFFTYDRNRALEIFLWALAFYASGVLLGFLFGIPRVLQDSSKTDALQADAGLGQPKDRSTYRLMVNTNLDDVSDWLTKTVVGVSLVEMRQIAGSVYRFSSWVAGGTLGQRQLLPEAAGGEQQFLTGVVAAVVVYFSVLGFISGYLTTRMFFERAFSIADSIASGSSREVVETEVVKTAQTVSARTS